MSTLNSWQRFLKRHANMGYSRSQLQDLYYKEMSLDSTNDNYRYNRRHSPRRNYSPRKSPRLGSSSGLRVSPRRMMPGRSDLLQNEEEVEEEFYEHDLYEDDFSLDNDNEWIQFQKRYGGMGWSQDKMVREYYRQKYGLDNGNLERWRNFEQRYGGLGLSKQQMQGLWHITNDNTDDYRKNYNRQRSPRRRL